MLLFPDQRIEQPENETCAYAAPIDQCDWDFLHARARTLKQTGMKFLILVDESTDVVEHGVDYTSVYYMRNDSEVNDRVAILFRDMEDQDCCIESAAWLRIAENYPGMIFIARGSTNADKWQTHAAALGSPDGTVCMVDISPNFGES